LDTDYAQATAELARTQIIQQASMAVLAQANSQPQTVLKLLQG
jgi:flagellin